MNKKSSIENSLDKKILLCIMLYVITLLFLLLLSYTPLLNHSSFYKLIPVIVSLVIMMITLIIAAKAKNKEKQAGFIITVSVLTAAGIYTTFQQSSILLFIFPLLLALLFNSKKLLIYTCSIVCVSLLGGATASIFLINKTQNFAEAFVTIGSLFITSFSELIVIIILCSILFSRIQGLLIDNKVSDETVKMREKILDSLLYNSQRLASANDLYSLHLGLKDSIIDLVSFYTDKDKVVFHMGMLSHGQYNLDDVKNYTKLDIKDNVINIKRKDNEIFSIDLKSDNAESVFIDKNYILLKLFTDSSAVNDVTKRSIPKMTYYIYVEGDFTNVDHSFQSHLKMLQKTMENASNNLLWRFTLQSSQKEMIFAIAQVSESRSHQTGRHIIRVSEYMKVLCKAAGYSDTDANQIGIASMLHDVGKLYIPSEIIEKKGKLTDDEYSIMKNHVNYGVQLIKNCPGDVMEYARLMIKEHHERYDGNGYNKLKPNQTSFISRLLCVADVFDALVSKRSYKDGWDPKEAYDLIINESGTHFDPECVAIFKKCYTELIYIHRKYPDE